MTVSPNMPDFMGALFKSVDDGIIVGDINGQIIFANDSARRINDNADFPSNPDERILHYFSGDGDDQPIKPSDLPLRVALAKGEVRGFETSYVTPAGHKKNLICNGRALFGARGERIGAILVMHDRTEERAAAEQKRGLENERTDLLRINAELERFSAIAAHDLKSPLNSITQFVELLHESLGDKVGPNEAILLQRIVNAGTRLRALIDDLLGYARAGKSLGEKASVDLDGVINDVLAALRGELGQSKALVDVGAMPVVYGDRIGISQVFQNLISNAVKYRSESALIITIRAQETESHWHLSVKDNGIGIAAKDHSAALELFKRVESTTKCEGTGLGLPICKRIIEAHGGTLMLDSERGKGTNVLFTLPKLNLSTGN